MRLFRSMAGQMFLLLLVGIAAAAVLAVASATLAEQATERQARTERLVERLVDLKTVLEAAPAGLGPALLGAGPEAPRLAQPGAPEGLIDLDLTTRLAARLGGEANVSASTPDDAACRPHPPARPPRLRGPTAGPPPPTPSPVLEPPAQGCRLVAFSLSDGRRIVLVTPTGPKPPPARRWALDPVYLLVMIVAAAALAYGVAYLATRPLVRLSKAAVALGRDLERAPLAIEGPIEVRHAAAAFNAMQVELRRNLEERTQMLAAITHDLQTPLTRQRLRLEKVADPELRARLLDDQAAMMSLIRDGLDLARAAGGAEALERLDLDSLLEALVDDACAAGHNARVVGRSGASIHTRPETLKRCVANLLDNALQYAGSAELSIETTEGLSIHVRDRGPGIPAESLSAVLQPFVRLETSRSRETGGAGLGLAIARTLADRAGGQLELRNRSGGGLDALVRFATLQG